MSGLNQVEGFFSEAETRGHADEKEDIASRLPDVPSYSPERETKKTRTALTS